MAINEIKTKTLNMIDDLKAVCSNFGLGNASSEYKIITEVFLYKFINDKFIYEALKLSYLSDLSAVELDEKLKTFENDEYEMFLMDLKASTAKIKKNHLISSLYSNKNKSQFHKIFDSTLRDIADFNIDIFSVQTGGQSKIRLFEGISQYVVEEEKKDRFCRAIIDKIVDFSFNDAFGLKYDFFADIFEYLIKDYNKDFGKYAEYYTPHSISQIIAKILKTDEIKNVTVYDPAAGSGTLVLSLAHEIGEDNCTIYTQDISQKSNEFLRLNLILNNLVHSLPNVIHEDTLVNPMHLNREGDDIRKFDYIVSNPPFNTDFSENRNLLAGKNYQARFFAGVPAIPKKDKKSMPIYQLFMQHILVSLNDDGKAAIVVPSGFLTDSGKIPTEIRKTIVNNKWLSFVIQMPTNVFANTNTSVSIVFLDKSIENNETFFIDASKLGSNEKIDDVQRVVIGAKDENKIISHIETLKEENEFSKLAKISDIIENDYLIKPGLYFDMEFHKLHEHGYNIQEEKVIFKEQMVGLVNTLSDKYSRNLFIEWFVDFKFEGFSGKLKKSEYGDIPEEFDLVPLEELILDTLGGEWGKEEPSGNYSEKIKCIRGADLPDIVSAKYDKIPTRYVTKKHIGSKEVKPNDIILEISGGSPIQSTGRIAFIDKKTIEQLVDPVLCTNFCRILRFKDENISKFVYDYLQLLYDRKYFFNLENNTTGIKNLIYKAFSTNIKVPLPKNRLIINEYYNKIKSFNDNIYNSL